MSRIISTENGVNGVDVLPMNSFNNRVAKNRIISSSCHNNR